MRYSSHEDFQLNRINEIFSPSNQANPWLLRIEKKRPNSCKIFKPSFKKSKDGWRMQIYSETSWRETIIKEKVIIGFIARENIMNDCSGAIKGLMLQHYFLTQYLFLGLGYVLANEVALSKVRATENTAKNSPNYFLGLGPKILW